MAFELRLLPRYLKNLGIFRGLSAYCKVEFFGMKKFKLHGYAHYFFLRPYTTDKKVFREIFLLRAYAFNLNFVPRVIIDAGANIGLSSVFFAKRFPDAMIYSIEPESRNFECLVNNTLGYDNIKRVQTALWNRDAMLKISDKNETQWAFSVQECNKNDPESFPGISLTSFMQNEQIAEIDVLKIDIEGAEQEVFSESYDYWVKRTKVIVIELHDWLRAGCSSVFFKAISRYKIKTTIHEGMLIIELLP